MKSKIRIALGVVLCMVVSIIGNKAPVSLAAGWADDVTEEIDVDTSYEESITESDYKDQQGYYYDAYKVTIPEKGNIKVYVESANERYTKYGSTWYFFYKSSDIDKNVWSWHAYGDDYSSARDRYYASSTAVLPKGTYYFVVKGNSTTASKNIPYTFELDYSPSITAPTVRGKKAAKKSITLNWNRVSNADGYEVKYSTNSKMSGAVKMQLDGINSTSTKLTGLKRKTTYYIKVRCKRTMEVGGQTKTYSSAWSTKQVIRTK